MEKVYVVEGKNDIIKLKQVFPDIKVISVGGSAVNSDKIELIKTLEKTHEVVIVTDPDYAGSKIRNFLVSKLTNPTHIFVDEDKAKTTKKIGIEHMSAEDLIKAFTAPIKKNKNKSDISMSLLYKLKLIGSNNSKDLRDKLTAHLKIGKTNGKTLLERLHMIGLKEQELKIILESINVGSVNE